MSVPFLAGVFPLEVAADPEVDAMASELLAVERVILGLGGDSFDPNIQLFPSHCSLFFFLGFFFLFECYLHFLH